MSEITATDAARAFSDLLDRVEHRGHSFTVTRKGRPVARICPAGPRTITVGELLHAAPKPDDDFAADLDEARRQIQAAPGRDHWASS
ncbi:MAG: type II toxin-antitoxin system Phd/YefM family antitoxin [Egibacteraceae bacterium]